MTDLIDDPVLRHLVWLANTNGQLETISHRYEQPMFRPSDVIVNKDEAELNYQDIPDTLRTMEKW